MGTLEGVWIFFPHQPEELVAFKQECDFIWFRFIKDGTGSSVGIDCKEELRDRDEEEALGIVPVSGDDSLAYGEDGKTEKIWWIWRYNLEMELVEVEVQNYLIVRFFVFFNRLAN